MQKEEKFLRDGPSAQLRADGAARRPYYELISVAPLEPQSGFAQIPEIRGWTLRRLSSLKRVLKIHESAA